MLEASEDVEGESSTLGAMEEGSRRAEYAQATRRALVDAARELFAENGYAETSIEDVVRRARVTRGALYHHFETKAELFRAVFDQLEDEVGEQVMTAAGPATNAWQSLTLGTEGFLDACLDPAIQRIVIIEAPAVLGWQQWREYEQAHGLGLIRKTLERAMEEGVIGRKPVEPLAHMLLASLNEAAMYIARSNDRERARDEVGITIRALLEGLRAD